MNLKKHLLHGIIAGLLAAVAGVIYLNIYKEALGVNYTKIINPGSIAGSCVFGCMLMAISYALLQKYAGGKYYGVVNVLISVMSFASIIGPISMSLPLDTLTPELFPGLVIPMHFFPALAFFTITPFFKYSS